MVKVKVCGITRLEDAKAAIRAGCDCIGFVFYRKSPRFISEKKASLIARSAGKRVLKAGVFVNAREKTIKRLVKSCKLDIIQLHGRESALFCRNFKGVKVLKAFRVKGELPRNYTSFKVYGYLFDTYRKGMMGGTGRPFRWSLLKGAEGGNIFLSGGLNAGNVSKAILAARPDWVDVSSGVELSPGIKDPEKIRNFINKTRESAVS